MATLEQVFQQEKAWIAGCDDVDALMDRIGEWREDARVAEQRGHHLLRMRAGDLIELAQTRVVRLKAAAIQAEEQRRRQAEPPAVKARPEAFQRATESRPRTGEPRAPDDAQTARAEDGKVAATRLANAQAAKLEAEAAMMKARAVALMRENAKPAAASVPVAVGPRVEPPQARPGSATPQAPSSRVAHPRPASRPSAQAPTPTAAPRTVSAPEAPAVTEADRLALASVGRWPPKGVPPGHPFWSRDQDWPAEWTLTGLDLASFRGRIAVTQKVLAAQLGMPTAEIAALEGRPREKVGPAMQIALRKAMEVVGAEERKRREAAAAERGARAEKAAFADAPIASPVLPEATTSPPAGTVPGAAAAPARSPLTGADVARLRAARNLSQRQLAELLGVGHGMVAKAEVAAWEPLGERMRTAMEALVGAAGGSAPQASGSLPGSG